MYWIDCHIHLSTFQSSYRETLFQRSKEKNIRSWVLAGLDSADWSEQKQIIGADIYPAFGLHPWRVISLNQSQIDEELKVLSSLLRDARAIGETGIDSFRATSEEQIRQQERVFLKHLEINKPWGKPVILHIVKSHEKAIEILKGYSYRGLVHGYSGSWEMAKKYIDQGYMISVGRGAYHKGYKALKETIKHIPLDSLLVESDAYFEAGAAEDPVDLFENVVRAVCQLKNISAEKLQEAVFHNIKALFKEP